jgi:two-component system, NarL family, nitrate/nitrite response regulator NarL
MGFRCFIVDDNRSFLAAARALLEREGVSVVGVASTGAEALQELAELRPDVVLVDIWLGEESGLELARRLVEDGEADGVPAVLISTRAEAEVADLIAESPAVGFVSKPELSAAVIRGLIEGRSS